MPKPICLSCERELQVDAVGMIVQFNAKAVGGAYEQWRADRLRCTGCGRAVIVNYGANPTWRHHMGERTRELPDYIIKER